MHKDRAFSRTALLGGMLGFAGLVAISSGVDAVSVDSAQGDIAFVARQSDVDMEGRFRRFAAKVDFSADHPEKAKLSASIDLASVDAGGRDANALLVSKAFFDAATHPVASFSADQVTPLGNGGFRALGSFSLKGHTGKLAIDFAPKKDKTGTWLEGHTNLSRLAYQIGEGEWADTSTLDDQVQLRFRLRVGD